MSGTAAAQAISDAELQRRQAEQQEQAQKRVTKLPDVLTPAPDINVLTLPEETPCFAITSTEWHGAESFDWIKPEAAPVLNRCIGARGLRALQDHLARKLLAEGYVTTRVLLPEQNLAGGKLTIQILPGRISAVRDKGNPIGLYRMAFPAREGELVNQRDLDQALENIRRVQGQQAVEFELVPGANPGDTEIVIKHPDSRRVHGLITLDDSGAEPTGKYQLGATITVDSPLHLYDTLAVTLNSNANMRNDTLASRAYSLNWSVPVGYWSAFVSANQSTYKQTVAGFAGDIVYSGRSRALEVGIAHVLYRSANAKGAVQFKLNRKTSTSDIDDTEILVQRRDVVGYEAGFTHRQYLGSAVLDAGVSLKGSLPKFSAEPGLILGVPNWDGRYQLHTVNASFGVPFKIAAQDFRYQATWRLQHAATLLPPTEFISIGNRYTVRGFDGLSTLAAEDGWVLRNDLAWSMTENHQLFLALDAGRVNGPSADLLIGRSLAGAAIGARGRFGPLSYETTIGRPISKPAGFSTKATTITASLAVEF